MWVVVDLFDGFGIGWCADGLLGCELMGPGWCFTEVVGGVIIRLS